MSSLMSWVNYPVNLLHWWGLAFIDGANLEGFLQKKYGMPEHSRFPAWRLWGQFRYYGNSLEIMGTVWRLWGQFRDYGDSLEIMGKLLDQR